MARVSAVSGMADLQKEIAKKYNMSRAQLLGDSRCDHIVKARHEAMYLAHYRLGASYSQIGRAFGGRDHTTVAHAVNKFKSADYIDAEEVAEQYRDGLTIPQICEEHGIGKDRLYKLLDEAGVRVRQNSDCHKWDRLLRPWPADLDYSGENVAVPSRNPVYVPHGAVSMVVR